MSEFRTLTERINALTTDAAFGTYVDRDEVLAIVANAVPVEIDKEMYLPDPARDDREARILAVVSTVYNLLADTAAEFAAEHVRRKMEARGLELLSDAEAFAHNKAEGNGGATSYHDLAHHSSEVIQAIGELFEHLEQVSIQQAEIGLQLSDQMVGGGGLDLMQVAKALGISLDTAEGDL